MMKLALPTCALLITAALLWGAAIPPDRAVGQTPAKAAKDGKPAPPAAAPGKPGVAPARPAAVTPPAKPQAPTSPAVASPRPPVPEPVASLLMKFAEVCSAGKAAEAAALFSENGELVDETGRVYDGRAQITGILGELVEQFPGAKFGITLEGARALGKGTSVVDAIQQVTAAGGGAESRQRIVAVVVATDGGWEIGSLREYSDPEIQTPALQLKPLEWLVGEWIDEDRKGDVLVSCRWSEDGNYLLRTFTIRSEGKVRARSTQRIGWDPVQKQIRAWHFDSDGSFGESTWSQVGDQWLVRATSTLADGRNGSAMHILTPSEGNMVNWRSTFRIVGDAFEPDRESVMVRQPPKPVEAPKSE